MGADGIIGFFVYMVALLRGGEGFGAHIVGSEPFGEGDVGRNGIDVAFFAYLKAGTCVYMVGVDRFVLPVVGLVLSQLFGYYSVFVVPFV